MKCRWWLTVKPSAKHHGLLWGIPGACREKKLHLQYLARQYIELPLSSEGSIHGLLFAATAGMSDLASRVKYVQLTKNEQHVIPLAGVTTALVVYPKRTAFAEEPAHAVNNTLP